MVTTKLVIQIIKGKQECCNRNLQMSFTAAILGEKKYMIPSKTQEIGC